MVLKTIFRAGAVGVLVLSMLLAGMVLLRPTKPTPILSLTGFDVNSGAGSGLWLRDLTRQLRLRLLDSERLLYTLWLPSGDELAYFFDDSQGTAIYLYDVTTGKTTVGPIIPRLVPLSWSPDARYLLLYNFSTNDLMVMSHDSAHTLGEPAYLATASADALWAADSQRLYFRDVAGTLSRIDVACLDGQGLCIPQVVESERSVDQLAGWMPNETDLMVFSGSRESGQPDLYSLNPVDGTMVRIAQYLLPGTLPVWSPDGQVLAVSLALPTSDDDDLTSEPIPGVYMLREGERPTLLWTGIAGQLGWSSDGRLLAFELVTRVGNDRSVWVYERATEALRRLTPAGEHEAAPAWVSYSGRAFDVWPLLLLDALLVLGLWFTRPRTA
jgi:Tol biopolymer transport system component